VNSMTNRIYVANEHDTVTVIDGATVVQDTVYWGSGYAHFGPFFPFTGNNKFFAFTPNGT